MQGQYPQGSWNQQPTGWQQWYQQVAPAYPAPPSRPPETRELTSARRSVQEAISKRGDSDRKLSAAWVVVPMIVLFALSAVGFGILFADLLDDIEAGSEYPTNLYTSDAVRSAYLFILPANLFHTLAFTALIYLLLDRKNRHMDRERGLREAIMQYVGTAATAHGSPNSVAAEMSAMGSAHMSSLLESKSDPMKFAVAFAIVAGLAIPIMVAEVYTDALDDLSAYAGILGISLLVRLVEFVIVLYVLNSLGSYNADHATQWNNFAYGALYGLYKVGTPVMTPYTPKAPEERSFGLYLILTIFTAGLFMYYWWYTTIKDPNEHYEQQWEIENAIASAIAR